MDERKKIAKAIIINGFIISLATFFIINHIINGFYYINNIPVTLLSYFFVVTYMLWKMLYFIENIREKKLLFYKNEKISTLFVLKVFHLICLIIVLFLYIFTSYIMIEWINKPPFNLLPEQLGPFVTNILFTVMILTVMIGVIWVIQFRRYPIFYFSIIFHVIGIIFMIIGYQEILELNSENIDIFSDMIFKNGILYIGTAIIILMFSILSSKKRAIN